MIPEKVCQGVLPSLLLSKNIPEITPGGCAEGLGHTFVPKIFPKTVMRGVAKGFCHGFNLEKLFKNMPKTTPKNSAKGLGHASTVQVFYFFTLCSSMTQTIHGASRNAEQVGLLKLPPSSPFSSTFSKAILRAA